jgi:hypothetical protein
MENREQLSIAEFHPVPSFHDRNVPALGVERTDRLASNRGPIGPQWGLFGT